MRSRPRGHVNGAISMATKGPYMAGGVTVVRNLTCISVSYGETHLIFSQKSFDFSTKEIYLCTRFSRSAPIQGIFKDIKAPIRGYFKL